MDATLTRARGAQLRPLAPEDSFAHYLREIGRHPLIDAAEESRLARRIREGDREALDRLVASNLRFVVAVAKRYRRFGCPLHELVTEGNLGLLRAAERYDERRGVRFTSYAVWWVRQSILEAIRAHGSIVRVPARRSRGSSSGVRYLSLDAPATSEGSALLCELVAREPAASPEARLELVSLRDLIDASLTLLEEREATVVRLCFGLDDGEPRCLAEIGSRLGVSRERVRQIRERALTRLRRGVFRGDLESFYR